MINYPSKFHQTQYDHLSETILFAQDLYPGLGGGLDPHILPVGGVTIKYHTLFVASNNSMTPETTTINRIFAQFNEGVIGTLLLLLINSQFVRNFSVAALVH